MDRGEIFDDLKSFAKSGRFKKELDDARHEFDLDIGDILKESTTKDVYNIMFDEWYTFERPEENTGERFPELYAQEFSSRLSKEDKERIVHLSENIFGFFKVLEKDDNGVRVKDMSTGEEYFVEEREALNGMNVGDVLLSRIFPWDDHWLFSGAILSLPEEAIASIEESQNVGIEKKLAMRATEALRKEIEAKNPQSKEELSKIIEDFEMRWNSTPQPDLLGLSPDNLEGALLKVDGLTPKEAAKEALRNHDILRAMYVVIKTGTDRNIGLAATTMRAVAELDPTAVDLDMLLNALRDGLNAEKGKWVYAASTELGRVIGEALREDDKDSVAGLVHSDNAALKMVGLETLLQLARGNPNLLDPELAIEFINSDDPILRGKGAMVFAILADTKPEMVSEDVLVRIASDDSDTVRDICSNAISELAKKHPDRANNIIDALMRGNVNERSVGSKARDLIEAREAEEEKKRLK